MAYHYHAFGLNIRSDFKCPELLTGDKVPDVTFRNGAVPEALDDAQYTDRYFDIKPNHVLIRLEGIARFLSLNGDEIIVDRLEGCDEVVMQLYLLGVAFAGLLHQRGVLPLHGSAVKTSHGVVVFAGHTGIGKSTLAGALHARGYQIFTDDILVVVLDHHGRPIAYPGFPEMKMTPETVDHLGVNTTSARKISWIKEKYLVSIQEGFPQDPMPLSIVYWLTATDETRITLTPIEGVKKFEMLTVNTFKASFLEALGMSVNHFKMATAIGQHVRFMKVERPAEGFLLDELVKVLEQDFGPGG